MRKIQLHNIESLFWFCRIAKFIDQDNVLKNIEDARQKLTGGLLIPYQELQQWKVREQPEKVSSKIYRVENPMISQFDGKTVISRSSSNTEEFINNHPEFKESFRIIQEVRKKYHKSEAFTDIIGAAILCGMVTSQELSNISYCSILRGESLFENIGRGFILPSVPFRSDFQLAIVVDPDITLPELEQLYHTKFKFVKNMLINEITGGYSELSDPRRTKEQVKRDREWYWLWKEEKQNGRGVYGRMTNRWNSDCPDPDVDPHDHCKHCIFDENVMQQGVSRYKKFLNKADK